MTVFAGTGTLYMSDIFTRRSLPVMATDTISGYLAVIEPSPGPDIGVMTIVAAIAAYDMSWRFSGCRPVIVARQAASSYGGMIKSRQLLPATR